MTIPKYWREIKYRYRLIGSKCRNCGRVYFPRRMVCPKCGSKDFEEVNLSQRGRVLSYTVIRRPPQGYERYTPYVVGLIELDDGVRIMSQIVDCTPEEAKVGMVVEAVFRKVKEDGDTGIIEYGYKFRPAIS